MSVGARAYIMLSDTLRKLGDYALWMESPPKRLAAEAYAELRATLRLLEYHLMGKVEREVVVVALLEALRKLGEFTAVEKKYKELAEELARIIEMLAEDVVTT